MAVHCRLDPLQTPFGVHVARRQRADCEARPLVEFLMIAFDHQNLVTVLNFFNQTADWAALGLQTPRFGNVQFHLGDGDVGFSTQSLTIREAGGL